MPKSKRRPKNYSRRTTAAPLAAVLVLAGLFITIALFSFHPADPHFGAASGEAANRLGLAGAWLSSLLIQNFGLAAVWPVPVLLIGAFRLFKKIPADQKFFIKCAGAALFLFSALAILSLAFPGKFAWNAAPGGGRFGLFLAGGAAVFLGRTGSLFVLPALGLLGLLMMSPGLRLALASIFDKSHDPGPPSPRFAKPLKGLEAEPSPKPAPPDPVIVDNFSEPAPPPPPKAAEARREPNGPYVLPALGLLDDPPEGKSGHASGLSHDELRDNAHLLESKLRDFGVEGRVLEVSGGPVITMYEYQPAPGIKISKVAGLSDDLTMAMRAISIRVVAPLPGKAALGIEIPNPARTLVSFKEVVTSRAFQDSKSLLSLVLGVDIMGAPVVADLARMPHLLIAGATGSGKSVGLGAMIMSILYKAAPHQVRFLMIDPKCVELALYKDIPHLIYPVLSDPAEATLGLKWAVAEMDMRYRLLAEKGVRNIETYNEKIREELKNPLHKRGDDENAPREMPLLVIIIDELADLMMVAAKEVEVYITRLAQKARAAGIHLILATQRPSVDVLTGIIKANLPTRISFQVSSRIDSRTILDQMGAEKLLGQGDMLFLPPGVGKLRRLHGAYVSDDEIKAVTDFIREWGPPDYLEDLSSPDADGALGADGEKDEKYEEAVELVRRTQRATISHVQRHLRIGYNRAARIIEDMERDGIIGPQDGTRPRAIF